MAFNAKLDRLDVAKRVLPPGGVQRFAEAELSNTRARLGQAVAAGRGADGQRIKNSYSKSYQRTRREAGLPTSPVNLNFTGQMMLSRQVSRTRNGARLSFSGINSRSRRSQGRTARNAEIARHLDQRGFKGFHEFGRADLRRIERAWSRLLSGQLSSIFKVTRS